jgi:single-strand DNA-binding protein
MNVITLVGRLGKDVEVSNTKNGTPVGKFSMATSTGNADKRKTTWHNITVYGKQAETLAKYVGKGNQLAVTGSQEHDSYEKDGQKKSYSYVNLRSFDFVGGAKTDGAAPGFDADSIPF